MSGTIGGGAGLGALGYMGDGAALDRTLLDVLRTRASIDKLTEETSTGLLSTTYDGLGANADAALTLAPAIASNAAAQTNAATAGTLMNTAQTALGAVEGIASKFAAGLTSIETDSSSMDTLAAQARDALAQVANLLNTKQGNVYVFAGQDSTDAPVPNADAILSSPFYGAVSAAVAGLGANGSAATAAATLTAAGPGATSPFSPALEASNLQSTMEIGGATLRLAPLADKNSDAVSAGTGTLSAGSYMRDILRGLATVGSLTSAQATDPNFLPFVQDTVASLNGAVSAINGDIGALGSRQSVASDAATELSSTATVLKTQLGGLENADLTQVAAQISEAQTSLQASYQLIGSWSSLSLAKFLPAP